jgi:hypothetical protein
MAGTIIADTIQASSQQISLNVGNTTILTASSTGLTLIPTNNVNINIANSNVTLTNANITTANITTANITTANITSISGAVVATQANQETATSTTTLVTPGRQQFHPSAAKAWIQCNNNGAIAGSYNIASIADTGVGVVTVTLTTAFSSTSYAVLGSGNGGGGGLFVGAGITNASVFTLVSFNTVSQVPQDSGIYLGVAFGDQ